MAKRFSETEIWNEDWFLDMPNEYKLFWFYMLAKCDHAGMFKVNLRSFRGLVEGNLTSAEALGHFNNGKERIRILSENLWYIEDFIVYQYGTTLNLNNRLHESIANVLAKQDLKLTSIRGLKDLKDRVKDKDKDKDKERKEGVGGKQNGTLRGERFEDGFVIFPDGSKQELGLGQQQRFKEGNYQPHYITKDKIE
jgi:hypothetical protein